MSNSLQKTGLWGSVIAMFSGFCCVLPMAMMLVGLGGSWLAVFGKVAAISPYIAGLSVLLLVLGWFFAIRDNAPRRTRIMLSVGTVFTLVGVVFIARESAINDFLITLM